MNRSFLIAVVSLCVVCSELAPAQSKRITIPAKRLTASVPAETARYATPLLRNSSVRATKLDLPADGSTTVAQDTHDYLLVSLAETSVTISGANNSFDVQMTPGEMQVISGRWQHRIINKSDTLAQLVLVEMTSDIDLEHAKCGIRAASCREVRFGKTERGEYSQAALFDTPKAKLFRAELGPSGTLKLHDDTARHLFVALTSFHGRTEYGNIALQAGEVFWLDSGFSELENTETTTAHFLVLDVK